MQVFMATFTRNLWELALQTKGKHEILGRYLAAWFPILSVLSARLHESVRMAA
jgi:hypothetical protein